jgi:hypothetical protein
MGLRISADFPRTIQRTLPQPDFMDWEDWAQTVIGYNSRLGLTRLMDENLPWEEFADWLCLSVPEAPRAAGFSDWREWAHALRRALAL